MLVLIFLFTRSVRVTAVYDKNPEVTVKFLFFTLVRIPQTEKMKLKAEKKKAKKLKKEEQKNKKKTAPPPDESGQAGTENNEIPDNEQDENKDNPETPETDNKNADSEKDIKAKQKKPKKKMPDIDLEMIMDYVRSASPPIKRLFKKIKVRDLYIDYVVGSDDAAKTALKYGGICAALHPFIKWLTMYFDVKPKEINIEADFSAEKDDIFAYVLIKLRVSTAIACVLWLGVRVIKTYLKYNSKQTAKVKKPVTAKGR